MTEEKKQFSIGKLLPLALTLLVVCELVRNLYYILAVDVNTIDVSKASGYVLLAFYAIFMRAIIPAGIEFILVFLTYRLLARRGYSKVMPAQDFYTITAFFISGALLIAGVIDLFAFMNATIFTYTSAISEIVLLFVALILEYFLVLAPKLTTARGKYSLFRTSASVFLVWQAIHTALACVVVIEIYLYQNVFPEMFPDNEIFEEIADIFAQYSYAMADVIPCAIAVGLYALMAVFAIVYMVALAKFAKEDSDDVKVVSVEASPTYPKEEPKIEPEKDPFEDEDDWSQVDNTNSNKSDISDIFDD